MVRTAAAEVGETSVVVIQIGEEVDATVATVAAPVVGTPFELFAAVVADGLRDDSDVVVDDPDGAIAPAPYNGTVSVMLRAMVVV